MEISHCSICNSKNIEVIYDGQIRNGSIGKFTEENIKMYQCKNCDAIWHAQILGDIQSFYQSDDYRNSIGEEVLDSEFYKLHDAETLAKFSYTGTEIFRNKTVADIGCGCGAFLDHIHGVAKQAIGVEPTKNFHGFMVNKYPVFSSMEAMLGEGQADNWRGRVDVVTSFDVIEHVVDPLSFLKNVYALLGDGGQAIIGTPTDAPIMRELLGKTYEKELLFSVQHLWIFGERNLRLLSGKAGFAEENIKIKFFQRYGIGNLLGWLRDKKPKSAIEAKFITGTLDSAWKAVAESMGLADYIVLYLSK